MDPILGQYLAFDLARNLAAILAFHLAEILPILWYFDFSLIHDQRFARDAQEYEYCRCGLITPGCSGVDRVCFPRATPACPSGFYPQFGLCLPAPCPQARRASRWRTPRALLEISRSRRAQGHSSPAPPVCSPLSAPRLAWLEAPRPSPRSQPAPPASSAALVRCLWPDRPVAQSVLPGGTEPRACEAVPPLQSRDVLKRIWHGLRLPFLRCRHLRHAARGHRL